MRAQVLVLLVVVMISVATSFLVRTSRRGLMRMKSTSGPYERYDPSTLTNIILYDGVCNFCNTWVNLLLRLDTGNKFKFAALQSNAGMALLESMGKGRDDISSVILYKEKGKFFSKSEAVIEVVKQLGLPLYAAASLGALLPKTARDGLYDTVASNRYNLLGKKDECRVGDDSFGDRFIQ